MPAQRPPTPEDALGFKSVSDAQLSPDGELVAFVVGEPYRVDSRLPRSNIWVVASAGGPPSRFTAGPRSDSSPRWSPDGQTLAFLSDRLEDGQRRLYLQPRAGGEASPLINADGEPAIPRSLKSIAWSPDGERIGFLGAEPETEYETQRKEEKDDAIEFEKSPRFTRLYVAIAETGEVECVSPPGLQVWEFCWAPDGEEFAVVASELPFESDWYTCRLVAFSAAGGPARTLHFSTRQVAKPAWSPDGAKVAFLSSNWSDRGLDAGEVFIATAGGASLDLSSGHVASTHTLHWSADSQSLLTVAHERGGTGLAEIEVAAGRPTPLWHGQVLFTGAESSAISGGKRRFAGVREDATSPADVWLGSSGPDGVQWAQLTRLHPQAGEIEVGATEEVRWKGADGWDIQGLLIRPIGKSDGGPHPMVTVVHGGPTWAHLNRYYAADSWYQVLAGRGVAVFLPNPRGSTGWGLEFAESNIGDMGGKDWEDILAGIDHCVERGMATPDRLGIAGSSYGGFMAAWAITQTDLFKAAVVKAGICDWRSFHGSSPLYEWDAKQYGDADRWDPDGPYRKFSPITYVAAARTATLILHGQEDSAVPVEQSYMLYRALKDLGVETELVVYPREDHSIKERLHKLDVMRRTTDWLADRLLE